MKRNNAETMNVLFLDDDPYRQHTFRSSVPFATIVETAQAAIARLETLNDGEEWHFVFLDHDLGGEAFVESDREDTGMEVVRWIIANQPRIGLVVCHSLNGPARANMVSLLRQSSYAVFNMPFNTFWDNGIIDHVLSERERRQSE